MSNIEQGRNHGADKQKLPPDLASASMARLPAPQEFEGITEITPARNMKVLEIDFVKAAAHAHEKPAFVPRWSEDKAFVVWHDDRLRLVFESFGSDKVPVNPKLPPYSVTLMVQPGERVHIRDGKAGSSLDDQSGHIIRAGVTTIDFFDSREHDSETKKPFLTLTINLDRTNEWSYPERPPVSEASRALKKSWNRFWHPASSENGVGFILESTARKPLEFKTTDEMRTLKGPAELIRMWERDDQARLEDLYGHEDRFKFAYDAKSKSYAMAEYTSGESDHRLYIFDKSGAFVGYYRVGDDGTREWLEGYSGELGKR